MSLRAWARPLTITLIVSGAAAAGQLGVAYGFSLLVWSKNFSDPNDAAWAGNLTWVCWLAATAAVLGAIVGGRVADGRPLLSGVAASGLLDQRGGAAESSGRRLSPYLQAAISVAAGAGALVAVPLVAIPSRVAELGAQASAPYQVVQIALIGVALGAVVSFGVLLGRPLAWNALISIGWVWLVAMISVLFALRSGDAPDQVRLALWGAGRPSWFSTLAPMLLVALAIAVGVALLAKRLRCSRVSVAVAGAPGPILVAVAYLVAVPGAPPEAGDQFLPYLAAPYAVLAGLLGSLLVSAIDRGESEDGVRPGAGAEAPTTMLPAQHALPERGYDRYPEDDYDPAPRHGRPDDYDDEYETEPGYGVDRYPPQERYPADDRYPENPRYPDDEQYSSDADYEYPPEPRSPEPRHDVSPEPEPTPVLRAESLPPLAPDQPLEPDPEPSREFDPAPGWQTGEAEYVPSGSLSMEPGLAERAPAEWKPAETPPAAAATPTMAAPASPPPPPESPTSPTLPASSEATASGDDGEPEASEPVTDQPEISAEPFGAVEASAGAAFGSPAPSSAEPTTLAEPTTSAEPATSAALDASRTGGPRPRPRPQPQPALDRLPPAADQPADDGLTQRTERGDRYVARRAAGATQFLVPVPPPDPLAPPAPEEDAPDLRPAEQQEWADDEQWLQQIRSDDPAHRPPSRTPHDRPRRTWSLFSEDE